MQLILLDVICSTKLLYAFQTLLEFVSDAQILNKLKFFICIQAHMMTNITEGSGIFPISLPYFAFMQDTGLVYHSNFHLNIYLLIDLGYISLSHSAWSTCAVIWEVLQRVCYAMDWFQWNTV